MTGAYRISSQFPLGVLGGGVLATVNQSAVLYIAGLEVRVAIRTERGWQRIEELANLRLGPVGAVPILQGVARIDGGEVRIRFAAGATPYPAVLL